jgi:hypothetical protein
MAEEDEEARQRQLRAQEHLRKAERYARSAERWSTVALWGSGCALLLWVVPTLIGLAVAAWVAWVVLHG